MTVSSKLNKRAAAARSALLVGTALTGAVVATEATAQTTTWQQPATGSDWFISGNWSAGTPATGSTALITSTTTTGTPAIIASAGATAAAVTVGGGANTLIVQGSGRLTTSGNMTVGTSGNGAVFRVLAGGTATIGGVFTVAISSGTASSVLVDGTGSKLDISAATGTIGFGSTSTAGSTLTISNGGLVNAGATLSVGVNSAGTTNSIIIGAGTNVGSAAGVAGSAPLVVTSLVLAATGSTLTFSQLDTVTFAGNISGAGTVTKSNTGTTILTGTSTYTGATTITGGVLAVNTGSLTGSHVGVTNATFSGNGTINAAGTAISIDGGGTFAPGFFDSTTSTVTAGTVMTVSGGNLVLNDKASYSTQINPTLSLTHGSYANITAGTATVGGVGLTTTAIVNLQASNQYALGQSFTILQTSGGGLGGSNVFSNLTLVNPNYAASLSYGANEVLVNFTGFQLGNGSSLGTNQSNVANTLNDFQTNGGTLPAQFVPLMNLSGQPLRTALSQLSGEVHTGMQKAAYLMGGQFLTVMLDPFVDGRSLGFAPDSRETPKMVTKGPALPIVQERLWSMWATAFGGLNRTHGDRDLSVQTTDVTASDIGVAAGLDYRVTPGITLGVAVAGGATYWKLADSLGTGRSDAFQAGAYGITRMGGAYLAGAFEYSNHWASTSRSATVPGTINSSTPSSFTDKLSSKFDGQEFGVRGEAGWTIVTSNLTSYTPYVAGQAQWLRTPDYSETSQNDYFGLDLAAHNTSVSRVEAGWRYSFVPVATDAGSLAFRGKVAYAHDWYHDPALTASFQALQPDGLPFLVNGAKPASDLILYSFGAEVRYANGFSVMSKFDGEFAKASQTFSGKAGVRYAW